MPTFIPSSVRRLLVYPFISLALAMPAAASLTTNPLLQPSPLPYQLPPFAQIKDEHFAPAFAQGMAEELAEVAAIAGHPAAPTFDNTIVALERSGQTLARTETAFGILTNALTNPTLEALESELAPRLAAHRDAIRLNRPLFARIQQLYAQRALLSLDPESAYLLERYHRDFVRAGAELNETDQARLKAINAELAERQTRFSQTVLKESNASAVLVDTRDELAGLSEADIAAAATAATAAGHPGKFVLRLTNTTGQPPLENLQDRALRRRVMDASLARGSRGGEFDNRATVVHLARLRAERAQLLGYPTHAAFQLAEQTAAQVATVNQLLAQLAPPAVANARREAAAMQAIIDQEKGGFALAASDWDFYSEKVRQARYAFDATQLRPYYELRRVLIDGVFYAATQLYGITFKERPDLQGYTPDMMVFEVFNADGSPLALFLGDFYARANKRGGAWMNDYVPQSGLLGTKPVIGNHLNIPPPPAGEPTLLTHDEVITLFHEFGHALHGMFSTVKYPRFSGTNVPRDFVEYPSQVNEMWADWPSVLAHYARHYQTGEPIPAELLAKVQAAARFNQGFKTTEYLAAALLDQAWHQLTPEQVPPSDQVAAFEAAALQRAGVDFAPVPPRYRTTYFSHAFAGGYSAGYYSYIWSEVLDACSVDWFKAHGGLTRANGDHFRATLLSRGGSAEAMSLYRAFAGSTPELTPLLKRRGLQESTEP